MTHVATHRQAMIEDIGSAIEGSARGARALGLITASVTYKTNTNSRDEPVMKHHQPRPQASALARASRVAVIQDTLFNTEQHGLTSDDYYTPAWIFEKLAITFDLDVAAPTGGCHWIPATNHYDQLTNGLTSDWYGNVFMNPPFSKPIDWVKKFMQHANGIALLPMSKSYWFDLIWQDAQGITTLQSSLRFVNPTGNSGSIFTGAMLFAYGEHNVNALHNIGRVR